MSSAGCPSFFALGFEDGHVPAFWLAEYLPRKTIPHLEPKVLIMLVLRYLDP